MPCLLPNRPLFNALTCCGNPRCGNKEAEPLTLKMCTACRFVSYCNVDCQKTHRKNHKHSCNEIAKVNKEWLLANYHGDDNDNDNDTGDDDLFQPIPQQDDCPICTLPIPIENENKKYQSCCGNVICSGCEIENIRVTTERGQFPSCAFCREPNPSSEGEMIIRMKKRMEMNDSIAILNISGFHQEGKFGLPKDPQKAFELCLRATKLGNLDAICHAAQYYKEGVVVPKDMAKARGYLEKAAKIGSIVSRHNLGVDESTKGNHHLASKHWLISAAAGSTESLVMIAQFYKFKIVPKKEYFTAITSYQNVHKDAWSIERERVAAAKKL